MINLTKVCILALDALEYDLVKQFNLQDIMQREFGKVDISMFRVLATPIIWGSFITGKLPEQHGISRELTQWRNPVLEKLRRVIIKLKLDRTRARGKGKLLTSLGFHTIATSHEDLVMKFRRQNPQTLFDVVPNAIALSVPPYQTWRDPKNIGLMKKVLDGEETKDNFEKQVWRVFKKKREKYMKILSEDWDLFMAHFMFTDSIGHMFAGDMEKMIEAYLVAEDLVKKTKVNISDDTFLLIVSDHGMKQFKKTTYGLHSNHGFYSSNIELSLNYPKITEFYSIITKMLKE